VEEGTQFRKRRRHDAWRFGKLHINERAPRTSSSSLDEVLLDCLTEYQNPIAREVMEFQIQIAVNEASALEFVPTMFRRKSSAERKWRALLEVMLNLLNLRPVAQLVRALP
jgi:hypothetical protein